MKRKLCLATILALLLVIFGTIYTVAQQTLRLTADDPQIQLAQATAVALNAGAEPQSLFSGRIDAAKSLAPFVVVYDKQSGQPIAGNGYLDNKLAKIPSGVLHSSDGKDYHSVTWQPQAKVRIASVTTRANDYYVTSGRNLKEVEKREDIVFKLSLFGGLLSLAGVAASVFAYSWFNSRKIV